MTTHAITPHTRIENSIIDNMAKIGVYGYAVYCAIKRHLNQKTGDCYPSYATIARKIGIDRGTVIRYVKKLKALNLISPLLRFKEDGSPTSNQYNFQAPRKPGASKNADSSIKNNDLGNSRPSGSGSEPPPLVSENNPPGCPEPPKQSSSPNIKQRTIAEIDLMPTEKQKTCPHPPEFIVILPDNITICNHCYGLLDENFRLIEEEKTPFEIVVAA